MRVEDLSEELKKKAAECKTAEEKLAFIKENNIEAETSVQLDDDALDSVSGGTGDRGPYCSGQSGHKFCDLYYTGEEFLFFRKRKCKYCSYSYWQASFAAD